MKLPRVPVGYTRGFAAIVIVFCLCIGLFGQSVKATPEPYSKDEFPEWANDIRRAEIVSVGSFPLSYLVTSLVFDVGRYIDKLSTDPDNANYYAPLFFGDATKKLYTEDEKTGLILGSIGVSVAIAIVDFIIGQVERNDARDRELRRAAAAEAQERQAESSAESDSQNVSPGTGGTSDESGNPSETGTPGNSGSGTQPGAAAQGTGQ